MMKYNNTQLAIVVLIAVAFVLVSPTVYGAVEPHILISMDTAQTTKPLQINDSLAVDIFSIDAKGEKTGTANPQIFNILTDNTVISILTTNVATLPQLLWEVDINRNGEAQIQWHRDDVGVTAEARRISGSGSCTIGWISSTDNGATWGGNVVPSVVNNDGAFINKFTNSDGTNFGDTVTNFGFGFFNSDGSTACEIKNITSRLHLFKPIEWDFTVITSP